MSKEITSIALKVFAIYVMVQTVLAMPGLFQAYVMLSDGSEYSSAQWFILISSISIALLFILSVFIWKLAIITTKKIENINNSKESKLSEEFILSIFGLYLIFEGLSSLAIVSVGTYYSVQAPSVDDYKISQSMIYLLVYSLQSIIGVTLVIKARGWALMLNKLRVAGTK